MLKILKKIGIWTLTLMVTLFMALWAISTISHMNIGRPFTNAVRHGFADVANGVGELFGAKSGTAHVVLDFKNGSSFENTHRNW